MKRYSDWCVAIVGLGLQACHGAPPPGSPGQSEPEFEILVLDDQFVELGGQRMPFEDFFYRVRVRSREAFYAGAAYPGVVVSARAGVSQGGLERLQDGLWKASAGSVEFRDLQEQDG